MNKLLKQKLHVKIGDRVQIQAGNHKGLIGTIISVNTSKLTATVDSVPSRKKLVTNSSNNNKEIEIQNNIHISNLMLWDNKINKASRIGYKIIDNKKIRYFKKSGNILENLKESKN